MPEAALSLNQAARRSGRSQRTLRTMIDDGRLTADQTATNRYRILPSALRAAGLIDHDAPNGLDEALDELIAEQLAPLDDSLRALIATVSELSDRSAIDTAELAAIRALLAELAEAQRSPSAIRTTRWTRAITNLVRRAQQGPGGERKH